MTLEAPYCSNFQEQRAIVTKKYIKTGGKYQKLQNINSETGVIIAISYLFEVKSKLQRSCMPLR